MTSPIAAFAQTQLAKNDPKISSSTGSTANGTTAFAPSAPACSPPPTAQTPQNLDLTLTVNKTVQQQASTALQIFPVAAVIEFIAQFVTLEPGDIISTGTPAGVGDAKKLYLKAGDQISAKIDTIGELRHSMA